MVGPHPLRNVLRVFGEDLHMEIARKLSHHQLVICCLIHDNSQPTLFTELHEEKEI